eukprot:5406693-Pyramimonas_sp.AAC.1
MAEVSRRRRPARRRRHLGHRWASCPVPPWGSVPAPARPEAPRPSAETAAPTGQPWPPGVRG